MAAYPQACMSAYCGRIQCDGREQKASKSGAFIFLRDEGPFA